MTQSDTICNNTTLLYIYNLRTTTIYVYMQLFMCACAMCCVLKYRHACNKQSLKMI